MDRTDFTHEAGGELLEDPVGLHQNAPEGMSRVRVVGRMLDIFQEGNRLLQLHRHGMDLHADAERGKAALILAVEVGNGLGAKRSRHGGARAHPELQFMTDEVEGDLEEL
jgi:hypothetical protein